jgi:hypothetical protein
MKIQGVVLSVDGFAVGIQQRTTRTHFSLRARDPPRLCVTQPDGRFAFVTHGGDGKVSMVDTAPLEVTEFTVPTALVGGGYVAGFKRGVKPVDMSKNFELIELGISPS